MTCLEKLKIDHPKWDNKEVGAVIEDSCPWHYGYMPPPENCNSSMGYPCLTCWMREIPENTEEETMEEVKTPIIEDSGDRTEFSTGAVRDMRTGKGRFDLVPLEVVRNYMGDAVIGYISNFLNSGDTDELYNALSAFEEKAYNNCTYTMLLEVAKHFEEGAVKYGESNWKRGIPTWCYIDSAVRHYMKWLRGDKNEPHDRAFVWNLLCCIWEVDFHNNII